jgi:hypothetical protein
VTFSEPIAAESVDGRSVVLAASGGVDVPMTATLSQDGRTLTITPVSLPGPETTLTVALTNRITDLAGNVLIPPTDVWRWELPAWQDLGVVVTDYRACNYDPVLRVDPRGGVVVAYLHHTSDDCDAGAGVGEIGYSALQGSSRSVSPLLPLGTYPRGEGAAMDLDPGGRPTVAWGEGPPIRTAPRVRVARWTGTQWTLYPDVAASPSASSLAHVTVAFNPSGGDPRPVLAWVETIGTLQRLFVRRWTGSEWRQITGASVLWTDAVATLDTALSESFGSVRISFDDMGEPVFYWLRVGAYAEVHYGSWRWYGACDAFVDRGMLDYDYAVQPNAPCLVHQAYAVQDPSATRQVFARAAGALPSRAMNMDPSALVSDIAIAVGTDGKPIVVWLEEGADWRMKGHSMRWGISAWEYLGSFELPRGTDMAELQLAVGSSGVAAVVFREVDASNSLSWYAMRSNSYAPPTAVVPLASILIGDGAGMSTRIPGAATFHVAYTPANTTDKSLSWTVCTGQPTACTPDPTGKCRRCTAASNLGSITSGGVYTPPTTIASSPARVYVLACQAAICDWSYVDVSR